MVNKNVLVIGASSGYGLAIANKFIASGFYVIAAQRRQHPKARNIYLDVADAESYQNVLQYLQREQISLDLVVYCAGCAAPVLPQSAKTIYDIERIIQTNSLGLVRSIKHFVSFLQKGGRFITIGSISETKNYYGGGEYCAAKAFNAAYIKTMRIEYLHKGVQFCNVAPGMGDTEFHKNRNVDNSGIVQMNPMDVAAAVYFIANQPETVCISQLTITPHDQAEHSQDVRNIPK